jgi:phenylpropionate dioxygenase-like ring-hydroxylating dioxygenase large terminal subunit
MRNNTLERRSAYHRPDATFETDLVEVTRGSRGGEYLRRFWQVVAASSDATRTPAKVTVLGEELILFRDGSGDAGLVYPRCAHRGTSLFFGRTEEHGIRCCYHGWLFDTDGACLEQPLEPDGGRARENYFQPYYPLRERYGLIFAYMGPAEKQPAFPLYAHLENLGADEMLELDTASLGIGGPVIGDFNWFQHYENVMDPFHVVMLHEVFSGTQFVTDMGKMPEVEYFYTPRGIKSQQVRTLDDGATLRRVTELVLPTGRIVPSPTLAVKGPTNSAGFMLPIDDTHFRIYNVFKIKKDRPTVMTGSLRGGRRWKDLSPEERRAQPGDYEAQSGQGKITLHSEDHLAATDRGVAMLRKLFKQQVELVASGGDPQGVSFGPEDVVVSLEAGNYFE